MSSFLNLDSRSFSLALNSKPVRDAGKLLIQQAVGRFVTFFGALYAMRMLGPQQLGVAALVLWAVAQGAVLLDLGLSVTGTRLLVNEPDRRDAIVSLVWGVRLRSALLISILMLLAVQLLRPGGPVALWLTVVPLLIFSALNPAWVFQGMERMPLLYSVQLVQATATAILYFALFRPGADAQLYLTVAILTQALGWGLSYYLLCKQVSVAWMRFDWLAAGRLLRSSAWAFATVITVFVYTGLEIPLITWLVSTTDAGIYRAAQAMIGAFTPILGGVPLLLYPRLVVWKNRSPREFRHKSLVAELMLAAIGVFVIAAALVAIPLAFRILLGPTFERGITPCLLLIVAKAFVLVANVPAWGLYAHERDKTYLGVTGGVALVSISLNLLLIPRFGIVAASAANVLSEFLILVGSSLALHSYLRATNNRAALASC